MNESLCLPVFSFKWPDACSPHAQVVENHVIEWVEKHQLMPNSNLRAHTVRCRYGWLAARCYPTAPLELLNTIADYIAWLFLVDDLFFDCAQVPSPRTVAHITAIIDVLDLNTAQLQPEFGERALLDICQRLRRHLDAERFAHFANGSRMIYGGVALQILAHINSEPVTLRQYRCLRRHGSGMIPAMALVDAASPVPLEGEVRFSAKIEQLEDSTNTIVSLTNDIFSLSTELKQTGLHENMVTLLAGQGHTLQEGIDITADKIRTEINNFTQHSNQLLVNASPALKYYIDGLRHWISGHQRWLEIDTSRYRAALFDSDADKRSMAHAIQCAHSVTTS
ncbi:terpene synthase family protein [Pseudomonas sp. E2-15]